jgi:hypothetical protein
VIDRLRRSLALLGGAASLCGSAPAQTSDGLVTIPTRAGVTLGY